MATGQRRRPRSASPVQTVYLVSSGRDLPQVFAHRADAERFAGDDPDARVTAHHVRGSVDEAVVFFDRKVVVAQGATVLDRTDVVRRFLDDPRDTPEPADVEWFQDPRDAGWHIAGFGIDKAALDAKIQHAIDRICRPGTASAAEGPA